MDGKPVKAVAQVTKQGFCYVFDRVTGKPVWPIEERPVPQSTVPGERDSPTQPFPTRPAPFDRQGVSEGRPDRLHAGAAPGGAEGAGAVPLRAALHPALPGRSRRSDARRGRGRELGGRRVRPGNRHAVRPLGHHAVRRRRGEVAVPGMPTTWGDGTHRERAGNAALETPLRACDRHRPEHRRSPVDGPVGRLRAERPRAQGVEPPPWGGPCAATCC